VWRETVKPRWSICRRHEFDDLGLCRWLLYLCLHHTSLLSHSLSNSMTICSYLHHCFNEHVKMLVMLFVYECKHFPILNSHSLFPGLWCAGALDRHTDTHKSIDVRRDAHTFRALYRVDVIVRKVEPECFLDALLELLLCVHCTPL